MIGKINGALLNLSTENPYLVNQQIEAALRTAEKQRMFAKQSLQLKQLRLSSDLKAYKSPGVEEHIARLICQLETPPPHLSLSPLSSIHAAAHARGMKPAELLSPTVALLERYPKNIGLLFTLVQICAQAKDTNKALAYVEQFLHKLSNSADEDAQKTRFSPALVALAVALYRLSGRTRSLEGELAKAVTYWSKQSSRVPVTLLREAGLELITSHNTEHVRLAVRAFQKLNILTPDDPIPQLGLLASAGYNSDTATLNTLLEQVSIPSAGDLTSNIDVDALARAGILAAPTSDSTLASTPKRPAQRDERPTNAKRRRRKPPKSVEEGLKPDPERWLPMRDRSYYRPRGKKGRKKASEATQGGISKDEETLELVGGAGAVKVEKALSSGNKKKKKGRK
jgi:signal recognition particle subunit SRP72